MQSYFSTIKTVSCIVKQDFHKSFWGGLPRDISLMKFFLEIVALKKR